MLAAIRRSVFGYLMTKTMADFKTIYSAYGLTEQEQT